MRTSASARDVLANREEKELRLRSFIGEALRADTSKARAWTLIAKSLESPVCAAVTAVLRDISGTSVSLRVVLLETEGLTEDSATATVFDTPKTSVRILQDQRFAAAHEQLTFGTDRLWIGDCMRRDPAKRDAFEMFLVENAAAALHADASFAKLWGKAGRVKRITPAKVSPEVIAAGKKSREKTPRTADRR